MSKKCVSIALAILGFSLCALWPLPGYGWYHPGVLCAKCINQCATVGVETPADTAACTAAGPCVGTDDPLDPPIGTDFFPCLDVFIKAEHAISGGGTFVGMCAPTTSANGGKLMFCQDDGPSYSCGMIRACACRSDDTCGPMTVTPTGGWDQSDCPWPPPRLGGGVYD